MIAQQLGRQIDPGAVTISDVIAMKRANVNDDLVINHIHAHGMAAPLQTNDLINLPQQGISSAGDSSHAGVAAARGSAAAGNR